MLSTKQLYLIAHKVRGEVAFDIACQMEMADGPWWIIPTSGHRAYPYWTCSLYELAFDANLEDVIQAIPPDLPDHYPLPAAVKRLDSQTPETPRAEDL